MPDVITHYLFGKKAKEKMDQHTQEMLDKYPTPYRMGACGPDYFFYYHAFPLKSQKGKDRIYQLGEAMHHHKTNLMFTSMLEYLHDHYTEYLHSYVLGFMMHYYADRTCHPYVYFHAGLEEVKPIYGLYHRSMEAMIDQWMLELLENKTLKDFKASDVTKHKKEDIDQIYPLIQYVIKNVYGEDLDYNVFKECWNDYHWIKKVTSSSTMTKKNLVTSLEKKMNKLPFLSSSIYAPDYKTYDVLNLKNHRWYDPCDMKKITDCSFIDLFYYGIDDVQNMVKSIQSLIDEDQHTYLDLIQGRGFDTNLPEGIKQKYCECLFERED